MYNGFIVTKKTNLILKGVIFSGKGFKTDLKLFTYSFLCLIKSVQKNNINAIALVMVNRFVLIGLQKGLRNKLRCLLPIAKIIFF